MIEQLFETKSNAFAWGCATGLVFVLFVAFCVWQTALYFRHNCTQCKRRTQKICRLKRAVIKPNNPTGTFPFRLYVFRRCCGHHNHVDVVIKDIFLTQEQINTKPQSEFVFTDSMTQALLKNSGIGLLEDGSVPEARRRVVSAIASTPATV